MGTRGLTEPWLTERNLSDWIDHATGRRCLMIRGWHGTWLGYVQAPDIGAEDYGTLPDALHAAAHGGLTHLGELKGYEDAGIFVGFDCCHAYDYSSELGIGQRSDYRTETYVRRCVVALAAALGPLPV